MNSQRISAKAVGIVYVAQESMAKSKRAAIMGTNWEWVDESKEVIESVKGKSSYLSASCKSNAAIHG